jgi:hypothetical protein
VIGQYELKSAQYYEMEYDATVLRRTIGAAQLVGEIPDEAGGILVWRGLHWVHGSRHFCG